VLSVKIYLINNNIVYATIPLINLITINEKSPMFSLHPIFVYAWWRYMSYKPQKIKSFYYVLIILK